jgi:hypothetical protein
MDKNKLYEELKAANSGLIHISFSELNQYRECGHKHLIEKYLKLATSPTSIHLIFGNAIHSALETGIRDLLNLESRIAHFVQYFTKEMMDKMIGTKDYAEVENFTKQGEHILRLLSTEKILEKYDLIGVEMSLYEKLFANFHFKGFIDLILKDKKTGRILIIDWKTSGEQWDVQKKKKNKVFMAQMRLYKYFYARKFDVDINEIDCKYIVLNRLKNKKCPELGYGDLQTVEIFSTNDDIMEAVTLVAETLRDIHLNKVFPKAKLNGKTSECFFCPYKSNPTLCNGNPDQYKYLLDEHKERRLLLESGKHLDAIFN